MDATGASDTTRRDPAHDLARYGFALRELRGEGQLRLPRLPALGLWRQSEGLGTLVCPVVGPVEARAGWIVLHDVAADMRGQNPPGGRATVLTFADAFLLRVARAEFGLCPPERLAGGAKALDDPTLPELLDALARLVPPNGAPSPADTASAVTLARALAARLLGRHLIPPDRRLRDVRIDAVLRHIEDRLEEPLRLDALAGVAGLSTYHFSRVFARRMGQSVQRYVRARRVARASRLLLGTELPLAEVAFACGFAHQSHFTTTFRAATGLPPGAFRAARRDGTPTG